MPQACPADVFRFSLQKAAQNPSFSLLKLAFAASRRRRVSGARRIKGSLSPGVVRNWKFRRASLRHLGNWLESATSKLQNWRFRLLYSGNRSPGGIDYIALVQRARSRLRL